MKKLEGIFLWLHGVTFQNTVLFNSLSPPSPFSVQTGPRAHTVSSSMSTRGPFPGEKRPEREANPLISSAGAKIT
jgi:hypothetical protein